MDQLETAKHSLVPYGSPGKPPVHGGNPHAKVGPFFKIKLYALVMNRWYTAHAEKFYDCALVGDVWGMKELCDRLFGKAHQHVTLAEESAILELVEQLEIAEQMELVEREPVKKCLREVLPPTRGIASPVVEDTSPSWENAVRAYEDQEEGTLLD